MKFSATPFLLICFLVALGCSDEQKNQNSQSAPVKKLPDADQIPPTGSINGDTINLSGKFVLFYGPETDSSSNDELQIYQELTMFFIDSLNKNSSIYSNFTSVNNIRIFSKSNPGSMLIVRSSFTEPAGMIISDGLQSPKIKKGYLREPEIRSLIDSYFLQPI